MIRETLNYEIDQALSKRGWTRRLLAIRSGMTPKHVSQVLMGRTGTIETYEAFAAALDLELEITIRKTRVRKR